MQTYSQFRPTGFDCRGLGLPDQQDWLVLPISQTRDSGPLEQSNFAIALKELGGESETVEIHRFGHWGPGWFEILLIDPKNAKAVKIAEEIESSLESYPVLDENDYSHREYEEFQVSWEFWGRNDYQKALVKKLFSDFPDGVSEDWTDDEIENAFDDLTAQEIDDLKESAAQKVNWEYQSEGSGVSINIKGLVDCTDTDKLADLLIETCERQAKSRDIKKLAKFLGADDNQTAQAIAQGLVFVSQIRALIE